MHRNAVKYKDHGYLAPGSEAYTLYHEKKFEQLDKHMAKLDAQFRKEQGLPPKGKKDEATRT